MKENVGRSDQIMRLLLGPALMAVGYLLLGGVRGRLGGLATIVAGALVLESGITRTCPVSRVLHLDTRSTGLACRDARRAVQKATAVGR